MRLLLVTPEYRATGGGIGTYYRSLLPALVRAGCSVRVIEGSAQVAAEVRAAAVMDGVEVETLEIARLRRAEAQLSHLSGTPSVRRALAASHAAWEQAEFGQGADVVEAADFGLAFAGALLDGRVPCVMQMHGSMGQIGVHDPQSEQELDSALALAVETAFASRAAAVQTLSLSNAAYWSGQSGRSVTCLRPAWAPSGTVPDVVPSGRIAVVGRLQRWKGPQVLCEALRLLGPRAPVVDWYGRDTWCGRVGRSTAGWLAKTYPDVWGTRLRWHAPVSPDEVRAVQAAALLNIVPSTWDVFNFSAVEGMASGRPVICSDGAGASELIAPGETGFVYPAHEAPALAAAIERALSMPIQRLAAMGRAARSAIVALLDPDRIAAERLTAYSAVRDHPVSAAPAPEWLVRLCSLRAHGEGTALAFLDQHPLKAISVYAAGRALRKVMGR